MKKIEVNEEEENTEHDQMMQQAESRFGGEQMAEVREIEKKILDGARKREGGYRGASPATTGKEPL